VVITDQEHKPCALKCQRYKQLLSPINPSQSIKQHNERCKAPIQQKELLEEDEEVGSRKRKARQLPITPFIPSSKQQEEFHRELMCFVISAAVPFKKLDNPFLRNACGIVGVNLKVS